MGDNSSSNNNPSPNNNASDEKYYFELEMPASREINIDAGCIKIYFKCNQEYSISVTGNITGLGLSHTYGKGDDYVTVSFDKVQFKDEGSYITWSEYGSIIFNVKEGPRRKFKEVKKDFQLYRRGRKLKV